MKTHYQHSLGHVTVSVNGLECDMIATSIVNEVRGLVEDQLGEWLSVDEFFEKIDEIYLDEEGRVVDYSYV